MRYFLDFDHQWYLDSFLDKYLSQFADLTSSKGGILIGHDFQSASDR